MGAKHSLEDDLITFKLTSKQMARSSAKCEKAEKVQLEKLKQALKKQNVEGAKIYAENAIREKNQALNFLRLSSRIDAVVSRLETAIRMQTVNHIMGQTVQGMTSAMKTMDPEKIMKTMQEFEKSFEDMDVRAAYMEGTMAATTATSTPADQVEALMRMAADAEGLNLANMIDNAGQINLGVKTQPGAEQQSLQDNNGLAADYNAGRK